MTIMVFRGQDEYEKGVLRSLNDEKTGVLKAAKNFLRRARKI